ncbi:hypothetical protein D3H65_23740 [Paraflavitalea soli]|uniref:Uncharacterized protein n=1 Tax=Paraflavitalea soli TaxID=2315862 RepID=A0A3B7N3N1_9BACT|nr:hypothetical protein D3H65_23740 [Paraflavitalea soli]
MGVEKGLADILGYPVNGKFQEDINNQGEQMGKGTEVRFWVENHSNNGKWQYIYRLQPLPQGSFITPNLTNGTF